MTVTPFDTTNDPAAAFLNALPPAARHQLHHTARITVLVHRAVRDHHWTVQQLVERCKGDLGANPGGVITYRLEHCADNPPAPDTTPRKIPFCTPDCAENRGWVLDPVTGCPTRRCDCRTTTKESVTEQGDSVC